MVSCIRCHSAEGSNVHPTIPAATYCDDCYEVITFDKDNSDICILCRNVSAGTKIVECDEDDCFYGECWSCIKATRPRLYSRLCKNLEDTPFDCSHCVARSTSRKRKITLEEPRTSGLKRVILPPCPQPFRPEVTNEHTFANTPDNPFEETFTPLDFAEAYKSAYWITGWTKDIPIERVETMKYFKDGQLPPVPCNTDEPLENDMKLVAKVWVKKDGMLHSYLVDYDRYQRPDCSIDQFDDSDVDLDKFARNSEWRDHISKYHIDGTAMIILDSPKAMTTNFIASIEREGQRIFTAQDLIVPNTSAKFLDDALPSFSSRASYCHASIGEFLRDLPDHFFKNGCHLAMDYCCTANGNSNIKPLADITLAFKRQILRKINGCLWLTVSFRGFDLQTTKKRLLDYVMNASKFYGYTLEWLNPVHFRYNRHMLYFFFVSR